MLFRSFKALANEKNVRTEIANEKKTPEYQSYAAIAQHGSGKAQADAKAWIENKETEFNNRLKSAKDITAHYNKAGRLESGADLEEEPKQKGASDTVTVGGKTYSRPANFTDKQWEDYKKSTGAK